MSVSPIECPTPSPCFNEYPFLNEKKCDNNND